MPHEQTRETRAKARHAAGGMMACHSLRSTEMPEQQEPTIAKALADCICQRLV